MTNWILETTRESIQRVYMPTRVVDVTEYSQTLSVRLREAGDLIKNDDSLAGSGYVAISHVWEPEKLLTLEDSTYDSCQALDLSYPTTTYRERAIYPY